MPFEIPPGPFQLVTRYFWIPLVVVTTVNIRGFLSRRPAIQEHPGAERKRLLRNALLWGNAPWLLMGAGILAGWTEGVFDYLFPLAGNPWVAVWLATGVAELVAMTWWLRAGGAERLAPFVIFAGGSPELVRRWWRIVLATNLVGIAGMFWLGHHLREHPRFDPPDETTGLLLFLGGLLFAWYVGCHHMAFVRGWGAIAVQYRRPWACTGRKLIFQSVGIGRFRGYSRSLTVGLDHAGLHLAVMPIFRPGHPPLFMPWEQVDAREVVRGERFTLIELHLRDAPELPLRVMPALGRKIMSARPT